MSTFFSRPQCQPPLHPTSAPCELRTEYVQVNSGGGTFSTRAVNVTILNVAKPVKNICTDLAALQRAGVEPADINCSGLLNPTDPVTRERIATDVALNYATSLQEKELNSNPNNSNPPTNE